MGSVQKRRHSGCRAFPSFYFAWYCQKCLWPRVVALVCLALLCEQLVAAAPTTNRARTSIIFFFIVFIVFVCQLRVAKFGYYILFSNILKIICTFRVYAVTGKYFFNQLSFTRTLKLPCTSAAVVAKVLK